MSLCCLKHRVQLWLALMFACFAYVRADILVFSATARHQIEEEFRDMPARFGDLIPSEGIKGMVVLAEPVNACEPIQKPPNADDTWIALIVRYNCSFEIKVRMAQLAGYDAAIVYNLQSNELEPMSAKDPIGITIPSVFVSEITGLIIKENYLFNKEYFVLINDDLPFNINTHLLVPFAIVVGICFLIMLTFMIVRCIKDRRRQRRHRLPSSSLKKIPTHKYTKGDPYETCAICLDDYVEGEKLRVLPCAHAYHTKCIDPWLTKNRRVCPVCKRKVFAADERVVTDSESDSDADDTTPLIRNRSQGTQGGTFSSQQENPFSSSRRLPFQTIREMLESSSGSESEHPPGTYDDSESTNTGEPSSSVFLVSDSHSINGCEPHEAECSSSSTKQHTVHVCAEGQELPTPIIQIASGRKHRISGNARTTAHSTMERERMVTSSSLPTQSLHAASSDSNDVA